MNQNAFDPNEPDLAPDATIPVPSAPPASAPSAEPRMSRQKAWLAMGIVALALGLLWISTEEDISVSQDGITFENQGEPEDAAAVGKPAPLHFSLKDINGVDVKLASFKGKVIVLNFWATWCKPCLKEIPDLVELQTQYRDDVVVLGVLVQDDISEATFEFARKLKINYPLLDANKRTDFEDAYGPLYGIPVSVIVGRDGQVAKRHTGIASKEQFEREIKALL